MVERFGRAVGAQEHRKLRARRQGSVVLAGLGTLGIVGWSIGAPTVMGALLGSWLDGRHPRTHSWTLPLLVAGLCIGCINAWRWLASEQNAIHREDEHD